ncbi:hypothetical protein TRFO_40432 [Tritrichomonas foetus]|uniref:Wntless-like transmembrane domain-containing protein n=1 Tax=Tritrichomonas foetus TaxID=1144522 RepID=A0A1J4J1G5_9EUKA|nr:hypothetical protein TRFO_40432 [Tritrichomonas foetus]|eukprot:OHS93258.1 hypothetical protein TRFO_40432 [Tritrichomonas foetus]
MHDEFGQHDSSDGMQEIQSEETFIKETQMWIDSATLTENIISLVGFAAIIILTISTGVVGTPAINFQKSPRNFKAGSNIQKFSFDAAPISAYNRFISFDITLVKKDINAKVSVPISFSYQVECSSHDKTFNKTVKSFNGLVTAPSGQNTSLPFHLFKDPVIDYQSIELSITMDNSNLNDFSGIQIITKLGTHDHTTFQAYFRFVYSIFEISSMFMLVKRMRKDGRTYLHKEQRMIIPILVCAFLSNNPFYLLQAYRPSHFFFFIEAISSTLFEGSLWITVLNVFDVMRLKNVKLDMNFYLPKLVYCGLIAFAHFIHHMYRAIGTFSDPPILSDSTGYNLMLFENLLLAGFVAWSLYIFVQSVLTMDLTERYKFVMYSASNLALVFLVAFVLIFARTFNLYEDSAAIWVSTFVVENVYVLMMIYYHWPYESQHDQTYVEGEQPSGYKQEQIAEIADPALINDDDIDDDDEEEEDEEEEEE